MANNKALVVNIFGGPGTGKSTLAAGVFSQLKRMDVNCELIQEYAKDRVWEESYKTLDDQLYVLGKQNHKQFRCVDKVNVIISDSPLLLCLYYGKNLGPSYKALVRETFNSYNNINYIIIREDTSYQTCGRMQTEKEAIEIQSGIYEMLKTEAVSFKILPGLRSEYDQNVRTISNDVVPLLGAPCQKY